MEHFNRKDNIKVLDEYIWKTCFRQNKIDEWLNNFQNEEYKDFALDLLNQFVYFNNSMIREMLISLYRDIFEHPIRQTIINEGCEDTEKELNKELQSTRFLGMGNSAESGALLLYYFRQVNNINKNLFINGSQINLKQKNIRRYICIDDMSITGSQISDYVTTAKKIKEHNNNIKVNCYLLFATTNAIKKIKTMNIFDEVESIFELDESFTCFADKSRYFDDNEKKNKCKRMAQKYGTQLSKELALGYKNSQLLLGLEHNTPNNTLPIFWSEKNSWKPLFKRYGKNYG